MESKKSLCPPARSEGTDNKRWKLSLKNRRGKKKGEKAEGTELVKTSENSDSKGCEEGTREEGDASKG